jgi:hypothetical protein
MMSKISHLQRLCLCLAVAFLLSFTQKSAFKNNSAIIEMVFINTVKGNKIVLNDSEYLNPFDETYAITKLRYYITNVSLQAEHNIIKENYSYHLIDQSKPETQVITFSIPSGIYSATNFLLGVDSLHNVSGAQTNDLDPAKDMFWTWNSGYVMAKMEGNSPASKLVNKKFEFHIGGFSGPYSVLKEIHLDFPGKKFFFDRGKNYTIIISADINTWWQHPHDVKISENANITSPGISAKNVSDNYAGMFHIEKIISE